MWPNDILFHVSNLSSGHIYLRCPVDAIDLKTFQKVDALSDFFKYLQIPINVVDECLHLTKLSSIKGSKMDSVNIDITPWLNVEKQKGTNSGTIHFKEMKYVSVLNVTYTHKEAVGALSEDSKSAKSDKSDKPSKSVKNSKSSKSKKSKLSNKSKGKKKKALEEEKRFDNDPFADSGDSDSDSSDSSDSDDDRPQKKKKKKKGQSAQRVYNKKQWKRKLKALEKTKQIIETKNVEKYLIEQQRDKMKAVKAIQKQSRKAMKEQKRKEKRAKQEQ